MTPEGGTQMGAWRAWDQWVFSAVRGRARPRENPAQPALLVLDQGQRVEIRLARAQCAALWRLQIRPGEQPRARGLRRGVAFAGTAAFPDFSKQWQRGAEEVLQRVPHLGVERIDGREQGFDFQPLVAEELPRVAPVLLLDVGVSFL